MTDKALTVNELLAISGHITEQFPMIEEDKIPDRLQLNTIKKCAVLCTSMVDSEQGGGVNGHIGILFNAADYARLPNAEEWIRATTPAPLIVPATIGGTTATNAQRDDFKNNHAC